MGARGKVRGQRWRKQVGALQVVGGQAQAKAILVLYQQ